MIELLSPAGDKETLLTAIHNGADAVYLGLQEFNARRKAQNFHLNQLNDITNYLHSKSKKIYIVLNILIKQTEIKKILEILDVLSKINPDAIIIQDIGLLYIIQKWYPNLKIHSSTQMNIHNSDGFKWAENNSINRIILPREISFNELKILRKKTKLELEVFVHGAMCYSISGLCFYSSYLGGYSGNRGLCTQPCRRIYNNDNNFFSMPDLCLIDEIPKLINIGINSFKIEGRLRREEYVKTVCNAYRMVIDACIDKENISLKINEAKKMLQYDLMRVKSKCYFYFPEKKIIFADKYNKNFTGKILGNVIKKKNDFFLYSTQKIVLNDVVRILLNNKKSKTLKIKNIKKIKPNLYDINLPENIKEKSKIYRVVNFNEKNNNFNDISFKKDNNISYSSEKINSILKQLKIKNINKNKIEYYLITDNFNILNIPETNFFNTKILNLNYKNINKISDMIKENKIFFDKNVFYIFPLNIPEYLLKNYHYIVKNLINNKYFNFIISHISQLEFFKNQKNVNIYSAYSVYVTNKAAIKYLNKKNIKKYTLSIENNFNDNLMLNSPNSLLTVFNYPLLFISKTKNENLKINTLIDDKKNKLKVYYDSEFFNIISTKPFSLLRRKEQLESNNITNFIIDLRNIILNNKELKKIIKYIKTPELLKKYTNFNFKQNFK